MSKRGRPKKPCRGCGEFKKNISRKGYCIDCSTQRIVDAVESLQSGKGEVYEKWRRKTLNGLKRKSEDS